MKASDELYAGRCLRTSTLILLISSTKTNQNTEVREALGVGFFFFLTSMYSTHILFFNNTEGKGPSSHIQCSLLKRSSGGECRAHTDDCYQL